MLRVILEGLGAWCALAALIAAGWCLMRRRHATRGSIFRADPDVQAARGDLAEYMDTAKAFGNLDETPEFIAANQAVIDAEDRAKTRRG